jgi:hypothetical protein
MGAYATRLEEANRDGVTKNFEDLGHWTIDDVKILHKR